MNYVRKTTGMVKWDIRIVFHKVRFRKMSQTDSLLDANRAPGMHLLQNPGPELSVTGRTDDDDDGRTTNLERSLHNRPFGQKTLIDYNGFYKETLTKTHNPRKIQKIFWSSSKKYFLSELRK